MADSKGPPPQTPVTPSTNKSTKASHITPLSNKTASHQRADHYASGTHTEPIKVPTVNTHLMQDCNTARLLPFEEFAIKILRLPEDWKDRWSAQLAGALELHEWTKYEDTWKKERHENRLYLPFTQLCNKAIATMTGGQNRTSSLVVYEHDKGYQIGYTKRAPDIASTLWGWAEKVGGKLDERKVFVGFDNKGFKKISWGQVRMFEEVKNTPNGSTFGGAEFLSPNFVKRSKVESSQTSSNVASSGSRKRGLDSVTASQTSAQGTQKRQRNSQSIRTSVGSQTVSSSRNRMSGDPPTDNNNPDHVRLQCAGYALEMLTSGRVRSHAFGMLVDGPNVQLQYYDRSIILRTRGISLFDQDERRLFLAALYRFTQFAPVDWGILLNADEEDLGMSTKHEIEKKSRVDPLAGMEFTLEKDGTRKRIRLVCLIFRSHGVIGRGTIVAEAVCICGGSGCECDWGGSLVVKISFPATSRVMEYELVSEALNKAVGEHVWVKNHLPRIIWAQNISFGEDTPQEQLAKLFPDKYEERHVCITVQRKLQPIHDLVTPEEFAQVFYDILQCHRWLYVIPKILHRDISPSLELDHGSDHRLFSAF
ncbi:hypothetical protein L218DRAFT_1077995 [Marasmius fiardii PR-910]|nr:hypothetical protein L218DRAFT_1077995 [Marasmius fiardii PR-910]